MRGVTHFAGILGWPLDHTLSPTIHNAAFRSLGLDWVYLTWPVPPEELGPAVAGLRALGAGGANVTMPHKETVIEWLDDVSGDARRTSAVNTIQRVGGSLVGHNTDVDGFREFLSADAGVDATGKKALVLGAGGAARAVVSALDDLGAQSISIAARTEQRGEAIVSLAQRQHAEVVAWGEIERVAAEFDLVVNATPLGMRGERVLEGARWRPGQVVCDLVYDPPVTPLMEAARAAGAEAWGGLGMLIHQAALSFRIWTGSDPALAMMSAAAIRALGA
ncbi:MAG: shikimate dehydrogenase [Actinomycetota bacterium]|nr:shikimate dehydrogenase [Actinomycetota bacterium]